MSTKNESPVAGTTFSFPGVKADQQVCFVLQKHQTFFDLLLIIDKEKVK